jgi:hypothetical protein
MAGNSDGEAPKLRKKEGRHNPGTGRCSFSRTPTRREIVTRSRKGESVSRREDGQGRDHNGVKKPRRRSEFNARKHKSSLANRGRGRARGDPKFKT